MKKIRKTLKITTLTILAVVLCVACQENEEKMKDTQTESQQSLEKELEKPVTRKGDSKREEIQQMRVIKELSAFDLDSDGKEDLIKLFYENGKVYLSINENEVFLFEAENESEIFQDIPQSHYHMGLNVVENHLIVSIKYNFVNKYGTSVYINAYSYKNQKVKEVWSTVDLLRPEYSIETYLKKGKGTVIINNIPRTFVVKKEALAEFNSFIENYQKNQEGFPFMEMPVVLNSIFYDMDSDGEEELFTLCVVRCGATAYSDFYISVYSFDENGIKNTEGWFESFNEKSSEREPVKRLMEGL